MREITANMNDGTTICISYNGDDGCTFDGYVPGHTSFKKLSLDELKEKAEAFAYFVKIATILKENKSDL